MAEVFRGQEVLEKLRLQKMRGCAEQKDYKLQLLEEFKTVPTVNTQS
jgi:hypothetical protein